MPLRVVEHRDPHEAHAQAGDFLAAEPAFNNVLLTVLGESRELGVEGRFWIATRGTDVVGFAMQSPPGRPLGLANMRDDATRALADAIEPPIPGVIGLAPVTSVFAGHFAGSHHVAVDVSDGGRLYELGPLDTGAPAPGRPRLATLDDRPTLLEWSRDFAGDTDTTVGLTPEAVELVISRDRWWVWDDNGPVSMVRASETAAGVVRVQHVYTPPEHRGKGYATASVGNLSRVLSDRGLRCILYTQLSNPTSNAIYRALGYEPVAEVLGYTFGPSAANA